MYIRFIKLVFFILGFLAFNIAVTSMKNLAIKEQEICIIAIGEVDKDNLRYLKKNLEEMFKLKCKMIGSIEIPAKALNRKRRQYYSPSILQVILDNAPHNYHRILGICDVDLYVPELNFIFGQADPYRGVALISLTRLKQEYYRLPSKEEIFRQRMLREALHELGHTYGLDHCSNPRCVMYFSNNIHDTDRKRADFCRQCSKRLHANQRKN